MSYSRYVARTCMTCGYRKQLNVHGTFMKHNNKAGQVCPGTGKTPIESAYVEFVASGSGQAKLAIATVQELANQEAEQLKVRIARPKPEPKVPWFIRLVHKIIK